MSVLNAIDEWPVDHAAAVVLVDGDVVDRWGDPSRPYRLASVTKLLSAYAVAVSVEEEAIALADPAGPTGSTVEHLLAHASGLAFDTDDVEAGPGERRIYSNVGFAVLATHLSITTEIDFDAYLREGVCAPLGMGDTALHGPAGYAATSTADDLARFAAELLTPRLIASPTHADVTSVHFPDLDGFVPGYGRHRPCQWGLGMEIRGHKSPHWTGTSNSEHTFGHFGQSGTFLWVDPAVGVACVVLTDRDFGPWAKDRWTDLSDSVIAEFTDNTGAP